jgi:hypothetical protein
MKTILATWVIALMAAPAFAQTAGGAEAGLATPTGHDLSAGVSGYTYREPGGDQPISIHAPKFVADYTGALSLNTRRRLFAQAQVRGTVGNTIYDGWCSPFLINPNSDSPNGYALDIGDPSPCGERGDRDWYVEGRALAGKDVIGERWGWSPYSGVGWRHVSNGTTGTPGYRIDDYLYVPVGMTARTGMASRGALSLNLEFDAMLHGWQHTHDSYLGGGDVPATATAPPFTIDGFSDISFSQSKGWAVRASAKVPVTRNWWFEPYYVYWNVSASPVNDETVSFTVNSVTASERLGAFEPNNTTSEFGVRLGFHF